MVKIPNMLEENVDYELVVADHDHWHIRILNGEFIELSLIHISEPTRPY